MGETSVILLTDLSWPSYFFLLKGLFMKYIYVTTVMPLLLLGSMSVNAATSANLKVGGELTSKSACNLNVDRGGVFELGKITASTVQDKEVALKSSTMNVNILCDEETQVTYQVIDNKEGTASRAELQYFGFGNINGAGKLGFYTLKAYDGRVDGRNSKFYISDQITGGAPNALTLVTIMKNKFVGWVDGEINAAASGRDFKLSLMLEPTIASKEEMNGILTEGVRLDGSATVSLFYGI
jgi:hypothetical protein